MEIMVRIHDNSNTNPDTYSGLSNVSWTKTSAGLLHSWVLNGGSSVTAAANDFIEWGPVKKDGTIYVYERINQA